MLSGALERPGRLTKTVPTAARLSFVGSMATSMISVACTGRELMWLWLWLEWVWLECVWLEWVWLEWVWLEWVWVLLVLCVG